MLYVTTNSDPLRAITSTQPLKCPVAYANKTDVAAVSANGTAAARCCHRSHPTIGIINGRGINTAVNSVAAIAHRLPDYRCQEHALR